MKIRSLKLENFRGIEDAKIAFDGKSAVIYGINGMGKSTVLQACNVLFSRVFYVLTGSDLGRDQGYQIMESDIKAGQDRAKVQMEISLGDRTYKYFRSAERGGKRKHLGSGVKEIAENIRGKYLGEYVVIEEEEFDEIEKGSRQVLVLNDKNMPVYATYSVNRYVTERIEKIEKDEKLPGKLEAWRDIFNPTINFKLFFEMVPRTPGVRK